MTSYPSAPPPGRQPGGSPYEQPSQQQPQPQPWQQAPHGGPPPPSGGGEGDGQPVCPRHPDRVSYVRCQRCGRPVCPECQRTAAVGVHCVDCVHEASGAARPRRTVFGATVVPGARPVITITMIAICVGLFLLDYVSPDPRDALIFAPVIGESEPWRMLTTAFLHAGVLHLALNMVALWFTGPFLEQALGRARFVALYLLSALGGSVAVLLLASTDSWFQGTVGASGAVFGLFGAVAVVMWRMRINSGQILGVIGINLVLTFLVPGISWQAHLGGLVTGAVIAAAFAFVPQKWQRAAAVVVPVAVLAALVVVTALRYATFSV